MSVRRCPICRGTKQLMGAGYVKYNVCHRCNGVGKIVIDEQVIAAEDVMSKAIAKNWEQVYLDHIRSLPPKTRVLHLTFNDKTYHIATTQKDDVFDYLSLSNDLKMLADKFNVKPIKAVNHVKKAKAKSKKAEQLK